MQGPESQRHELISFLRGTDFFGDFSDGQLGRIADTCSRRAYKAGTVVFDEDSESSELFVLEKGKVRVRFKWGAQGEDVDLYMLREGQVFGWSGLWDDVERSGSAVAMEDSTCLVMRGPNLQHLFKQDYGLGYRFMAELAAVIASRVAALKIHYLDFDGLE